MRNHAEQTGDVSSRNEKSWTRTETLWKSTRLGQRASVDEQRWYVAFRIDREIGGRAVLFLRKRDRPALERHADLVQRDVRRHRTRSRREVEREHGRSSDSRANPTSARPRDRCLAARPEDPIAAAFPTCARSAPAELEIPKRRSSQ